MVNADVIGDLVLNGDFSITPQTECDINATGNVTLKGNFYNHALKVTAGGDVEVAYANKGVTNYSPVLTINDAANVTIGEMPNVSKIIVEKSTKVTVNGDITLAELEVEQGSVDVAENVTALNNEGVNLGNAAEVTVVNTYGNVTMGDGAKVTTMTAKNSVTLGAGATVTNLTFTGAGTISKADEAATVADNTDKKECDIEMLTLDGEGAVTLNGVTIGDGVQEEVVGKQQNKKVLIVKDAKAIAGENLIVNGDIDASGVEEGMVAVATTKASAIYGNASTNVTFTSTWDGESQLKAYGKAVETKIYTATQFANLNQKNRSDTYYAYLMTDVNLDGHKLPLSLTVASKPWGVR